ncbi:MAG: hypothetical protein ABIQ10_10730 [Gemmatimonadaceae bacterium]
MKSHSRFVVLAFVTVGQLAATSARAQAGDTLTKTQAGGSIATASVDTSVHKKGGMFGKLKGVAHNKTVQNITRAAVCQALPGGQYMVGAAEAAKNKTSIASGAVNAQSCIPGMGGGSPLAGKGLAGVGAAGAMGAIGGIAGGQTAAGAVTGMRNGIPAGGNTAMTSTAQGLAGMQSAMAQMQAASLATGGNGGMTTEASGEQIKLSGAVADEIKKGKLTIKKIDWVRSNPSVSPSSTQGFMDLMLSAAQAMKAEGGNYRVDIYMDKKYSDEEIASLGAQRMMVLVTSLQSGGQLADAVTAGKIGKDKEQRVEIVKVK